MGYGSFFKGEKKKKKKLGLSNSLSFGPVFVPPSIIKKGKNKY